VSILIIGDDKYPTENLATDMSSSEYPFGIAAFIPNVISEDIDAFRRIICLIYGTDKAKKQIGKWATHSKIGTEVALEILQEKDVMLVNKKHNCCKIKKFLKENCHYKTVILLGGEAYKFKNTLEKLSIGLTILSYPHPSERSGDSIYWRDIDYIDIGTKYNKKEDLKKVFIIEKNK